MVRNLEVTGAAPTPLLFPFAALPYIVLGWLPRLTNRVMYASIQIPKPTDEQVLERAPIELFRSVISDPNFGTYGRRGQRQQGVDLYGKRNGDPARYVGVQCKLKADEKELTEKIIREEVRQALSFEPPLVEYFILTTAPDDARLQKFARQLEVQIKAESGRILSIQVWGWNTLEREIQRFPNAINAFMPDYTPYSEELRQGLTQVLANQADLKEQIGRALDTAAPSMPLPDNVDQTQATNPLERHIDAEIDSYRDKLKAGQPKTALELLTALKERLPPGISGRILFRVDANIASSRLALGDTADGIDLLIAACAHAPEEQKARSNLALAYLMKGDPDRAANLARQALKSDPDNAELAGILVQALSHDPSVEEVLAEVSSDLRASREVKIAYLYALRQRDTAPAWQQEAQRLRKEFPDDAFVKEVAAVAALDEIISYHTISAARARVSERLADALAAHDDLRSLWEDAVARGVSGGEEHKALFTNLILSCDLLGKVDTAVELISAAPTSIRRDHDVALRIAQLAFNSDRRELFIDALRDIEPGPAKLHFQFYDALQRHDWPEVEATGNLYKDVAEPHEREFAEIAARVAQQMTFAGQIEAKALSDIAKDIRDDFRGAVIVYDALLERHFDAEAKQTFDEAVCKVHDASPLSTRVMLAHRAGQRKAWGTVSSLLDGRVQTDSNTPELRLLTTAYVNSSPATRRAVQFFRKLPEQIRRLLYYAEREAVFHYNRGALTLAEECYRRAIEDAEADELSLYLPLISILLRDAKPQRVDELVQHLLDSNDLRGSDVELSMLAHFLAHSGHPHRAVDISYSAVARNPRSAEAHGAYAKLLLLNTREGADTGMIPDVQVAAENVWVSLTNEAGEKREILLSHTPADEAAHLFPIIADPLSHHLAKAVLGKAVGHTFKHEESFGLGVSTWTVTRLKHKYHHALHVVLDEFEARFPGSDIIGSVKLEGDDIQPILDQVRKAGEYNRDIAELYAKQRTPIRLLAVMLKRTSVECGYYLRALGNDIRACVGLPDERERAIAAIDEYRISGVVVDAYTASVTYELKAFDVIGGVFGSIYIAQSCLDELHQLVQSAEEDGDERLSLAWRNGEFYKDHQTTDDRRQHREYVRSLRDTVSSNCEPLARQAPDRIPDEIVELLEIASPELMDPAFCAGREKLLLSDDLYFRQLAQAGIIETGIWLQAVLMYALDRAFITIDRYARLVASLAELRHQSVSVSSGVLAYAATLEDPSDIAIFRTLSGCIGTRDADIRSHFSVAHNAILQIWANPDVNAVRKMHSVGTLLSDLLRFRQNDWEVILGELFANSARDLRLYILDWLVGHFLPLDRLDGGIRAAFDRRQRLRKLSRRELLSTASILTMS